ncbi:hypoxanthine-guanine phosphoribosyltransferase, partial [Stylosanthes scabra]|nr:hypoxanthine-guanine phosphoribosyltransferase [Stylosanthes scabra]
MAFGLVGSFSRAPSVVITKGSYMTRASLHKSEKLSKDYNMKTSVQHNLKHNNYSDISTIICDKHEKKYLVNANSTESHEAEPYSRTMLKSIIDALDAFRKFSRLYAFVGMVVGSLSSSLLAVDNLSEIYPAFFTGFLQANKSNDMIARKPSSFFKQKSDSG